ncbi:hypothetical protein CY0110_24251 [Crocosphaera chwakensis CCY0110]|uniref:Uncharacterized protein n=1 Tax=Crocosphaera chwakensis CCY0110 TaxID=391612 RepID=A3ILT4_9CHRO|nr:hypothetical protein CY0110_24251 [Crocosphaera chwakensis CCY0110]
MKKLPGLCIARSITFYEVAASLILVAFL